MLDFGDCGDDNSPLDLRGDYSPANTSSFDFHLALHDFLCRNHIDFIGPFDMRLEGTGNTSWRLLIEGKTRRFDLNASNQVGLGLVSLIMPSSPNILSAYETAWARASVSSGSSSVYPTIYSWL